MESPFDRSTRTSSKGFVFPAIQFWIICIMIVAIAGGCKSGEEITKLADELPPYSGELPPYSGSGPHANFDDGTLQGWAATGLWHVTTNRFASPSFSVWYGDEVTGDYNSPPGVTNSGSLTRTVDLNGYNSVQFDYFFDGEQPPGSPGCGYGVDMFCLRVSTDGGVSWTIAQDTIDNPAGFQNVVADLTPWAGMVVDLEFYFDTGDACCNNHEGAYVDNIVFLQ